MDEQDKAKAIEKASLYRDMLNSWAWKDLMQTLASEKDGRINKLMSEKGSEFLEFTKGFVACCNFIGNEIEYILTEVK